MTYYSVAFSIAHVFEHNTGMLLVARLGFDITWNIITLLLVLRLFLLLILRRVIKNEKQKI